jgi:Xaa-Pro dipeptidase
MIRQVNDFIAQSDFSAFVVSKQKNTEYLTSKKAKCVVVADGSGHEIICSKFFQYSFPDATVFEDKEDMAAKIKQKADGKVAADNADIIPSDLECEQSEKIGEMRRNKTSDAVSNQERAVKITEKIIREAARSARGKTEMELVSDINSKYSSEGVTEAFLDEGSMSIVHRNCVEPHRPPRDQAITENDIFIIDSGCSVNGFKCDISRSFCFNPQREQTELFEYVKNVQNTLEELVYPGQKVENIQKKEEELARNSKFSLDRNILHLPGHGVGLATHMKPQLSKKSEAELVEGEVIALEPAVYDPEVGGVRIEDNYLVTDNGYRRLSSSQESIKPDYLS